MLRRTLKSRKGFTLVELLIVVAILGILAAITVPQFTSATESARGGSLAGTVRSLRGQINLYKLEHGDQLPDLAAASGLGQHFQPFTGVTMYGSVRRGPYVAGVPVNPKTSGSVVMNAGSFDAAGLPNPVPGADFIYDYGSGAGSGKIWGTSDKATGVPVPDGL